MGADSKLKQVQLDGADKNPRTGKPFGASIPIGKAMDPDSILAYEMNGKPLPKDVGYPLRFVAPGLLISPFSCLFSITT